MARRIVRRRRPRLLDYCKRCRRRQVFIEGSRGWWRCSRCGWRNPDDF